jgi:hypothetical protein
VGRGELDGPRPGEAAFADGPFVRAGDCAGRAHREAVGGRGSFLLLSHPLVPLAGGPTPAVLGMLFVTARRAACEGSYRWSGALTGTSVERCRAIWCRA